MRRRRGGGLVMVLLVTAVLMVVAFAIAGSAVSHLQMASASLAGTRCSLLAQAAVSTFMADLQDLSREAREEGIDLADQDPAALALARRYAGDVPVEGGRVTIHFDPDRPEHSTDNSLGEFAAAGWLDRGTDRKSVPPFTVEVVASVEAGGQKRLYRAHVTRRWPYGVFSSRGCLVLTGSAAGPADGATVRLPATVEGPMATLATPRGAVSYDASPVQAALPREGSPETLPERLARVTSWEWAQARMRVAAPVAVGPTLAYTPPRANPLLTGVLQMGDLRRYRILPPDTVGATTVSLDNPGNLAEGDVDLVANPPGAEDARVAVGRGSRFVGQAWRERLPDDLTQDRNPIADVRVPLPDVAGAYRLVSIPHPPGGPPMPASFHLLRGDLRLEPDRVEGAQALGSGGRFFLPGDLGNRFVSPRTGGAYTVFESTGTLRLRNALLYVNGNVDLSATEGGLVGIEGSNATIIVNGTLALGSGRLDSRDQGMVIWARNVILRARGDYRGLIIARDSLSIMPASSAPGEGDVLSIRGAVMSNGPVVLRSTRLTYDAAYLKSLHAYGHPAVTLFEEL